jgi:hypothetical protein
MRFAYALAAAASAAFCSAVHVAEGPAGADTANAAVAASAAVVAIKSPRTIAAC